MMVSRARSKTAGRAARLFPLLLGLSGCGLLGPQTRLWVELPPPPPHWTETFGPLAYRLVFPDEAGLPEERLLPAGKVRIRVLVPRGGPRPFLAWPLPADGRPLLPPAGGLEPADRGPSGSLILTWAHGPLCRVLLDLARAGVDLRGVNVSRLAVEMGDRGAPDPWRLDLERISAALAEGRFRVTDIRLRPQGEGEVPAGPGAWFLDSPFTAPVFLGAGESLRLTGLTYGTHRLFAMEGTRRIDLYLDGTGFYWMEAEVTE